MVFVCNTLVNSILNIHITETSLKEGRNMPEEIQTHQSKYTHNGIAKKKKKKKTRDNQ